MGFEEKIKYAVQVLETSTWLHKNIEKRGDPPLKYKIENS